MGSERAVLREADAAAESVVAGDRQTDGVAREPGEDAALYDTVRGVGYRFSETP